MTSVKRLSAQEGCVPPLIIWVTVLSFFGRLHWVTVVKDTQPIALMVEINGFSPLLGLLYYTSFLKRI